MGYVWDTLGGQRVNLKLDISTRSRLGELKRDGETWDGVLTRAAEALEEREDGPARGPVCEDCGAVAAT
ncbi:hypothetical protein [uncultured Halorubrum sp.]|uniref:hypothetical protein n=1 Tax=uncultured Halorubrum sp. TaxID=399555 RepID=UPI0026147900|nr:hypothetical protein [uncultured Halorubrum sp.]